jgi:hypothetical protein
LLAASADRNARLLERVLLDALGAERTTSVSVRCKFCEREGRYEIVQADHKTRVESLRVLLAESFGTPPRAEEPATTQMPRSAADITGLGWQDMSNLAGALLVDELALASRRGGKAVLIEKLKGWSPSQQRLLREALLELAA